MLPDNMYDYRYEHKTIEFQGNNIECCCCGEVIEEGYFHWDIKGEKYCATCIDDRRYITE